MFFLYFCYAKKNYVIVEVKKKNDVTHYERNANCFLYLKKQQQLNHFLIRFK